MIRNDNGLSASLEKLSSGLRINKAADDASGMAIADSLRSQALGLGQAMRNANDGISMVQTADGALDEAINIVNTIKTKSIQAAQDGQTTESRKAIQSDVDKLMEELDIISKTTAFNNQKLLSGNFINKKFQVGAYSGETVSISIASAETSKIGHVNTSTLTLNQAGTVQLSFYSNLQDANFLLDAVNVAYDNDSEHSLGQVADGINKLSDVLGVTAAASVVSSTGDALAAGTTDADFAINGVTIGAVDVLTGDSNGALTKAINNKTSDHGIFASVDSGGFFTLTSTDNRAIELTASSITTATAGGGGVFDVIGGDNLTTLGQITLNQSGAAAVTVTNVNGGEVINVGNGLENNADVVTSIDSTIAGASNLTTGAILLAGWSNGDDINASAVDGGAGELDVTASTTLLATSTLGTGSLISSGAVLGGSVLVSSVTAASIDIGFLAAGTVLETGSIITAGSVVRNGDAAAFEAAMGGTQLSGNVVLTDITTTESVTGGVDTLAIGSTIGASSVLTAGSFFGDAIGVGDTVTLASDQVLTTGAVIDDSSTILAGSTVGASAVTLDFLATVDTWSITAGSTIISSSVLADGSTLGGNTNLSNAETTDGLMNLAGGSRLAAGSVIAAGTYLTNDFVATDGVTYQANTVLTNDITLNAATDVANEMTVASGSTLEAGSRIHANAGTTFGTSTVGNAQLNRLADVSVLTQDTAQIAIAVADAALKDLDKVRSDLGSVQNQLTSTIANVSTTKVNIAAAESSIRDVDFAEEAATFSKMQILTQASSFAMAQANASAQTVLSLLQG